ncbi:hypothetical protein M1247_23410 [Mycobacterium sp. 21AC1]|uniref:hypothetical protein n=1 Tax=[Mycobacterium] appelbergii TaxID=2939269 RepID=UPI0029392DFC|nr:hypothetical protein [Mycobacterium sp. 21AC1]MDV3127886.1 hypothetical protein [Mycobacterium sp. 21AC1]
MTGATTMDTEHVRSVDAKPMTRRAGATRRIVVVMAISGAAGIGLVSAPEALADEPPFHILSSQDLCNFVWPTSQAMPRPDQFGTVCARKGGVLHRLSRSMPAFVSDTFILEPGSAVELPVGSVRVHPDDPMSDWIIPDCHVPGRVDCGGSVR